uniref:Uncharacterized protein n=1 Tax=Panagrolaimus sp. ES5 TaxID=591445 RepID=A0AC34GST3_9BILA
MIKHDTVLEEIHQGSDSVVATIFFLIAKVYVLPDKNPTVKDHIKIIGSAVCSIIFNLLKLIVSKYYDWILHRTPAWLPKITDQVLSVSGYEKEKFKCFFVHQNEKLCNSKVAVEMYSNKIEKVCFLHFLGGLKTSWIAKCDEKCIIYKHNEITNVVVVENAIRLNDRVTINELSITFEKKESIEKFKSIYESSFESARSPV